MSDEPRRQDGPAEPDRGTAPVAAPYLARSDPTGEGTHLQMTCPTLPWVVSRRNRFTEAGGAGYATKDAPKATPSCCAWRAPAEKSQGAVVPSAQQHVEHDDCDRDAERENSNDRQRPLRRGRRVRFDHPHRARIGARTDRIVERNVGVSQAAVSAHHGPSRAVVLFQDRDPSEPPEPTLADVSQVGTRDTGRTATADAHTRKVRQVRAARLRREIGRVRGRASAGRVEPRFLAGSGTLVAGRTLRRAADGTADNGATIEGAARATPNPDDERRPSSRLKVRRLTCAH
jgi:hypothetical protein